MQKKPTKTKFKWLLARKEGNEAPLFWILDGSSIIRNNLPEGRPIYRIKTLYDIGIPENNFSIEKTCHEYVEEILIANKYNPLIIGGYSMGAVLALQTACILENHGIDTKLILLDPIEKTPTILDDYCEILKKITASSTGIIGRIKYSYWLVKDGSLYLPLKVFYENIKSIWYSSFKKKPPDYFRIRHVFLFYRRSRKNYALPKYQGPTLLMQRQLNIPYEDRIWPKVVGRVEIQTLPTDDHWKVINDPHLQLFWLKHINNFINN